LVLVVELLPVVAFNVVVVVEVVAPAVGRLIPWNGRP